MSRAPSTIRIATWNIHGAVGTDFRFDLERVVAEVRSWDADIVALQEVDSRRGGRETCAFERLMETVGTYHTDARAITAKDGDYGQLLASRWPITTARAHDISFEGREPRRAIEAYVDTPYGPLQVVAAHLGLSFRERRAQSRQLLDIAGPLAQTTVVMGDFNDWVRGGSVQGDLAEDFPDHSRLRTFPSILPVFKLDRIYCRPAGLLQHSRTKPDAWRMSDHLPVIAEIRMPGAR